MQTQDIGKAVRIIIAHIDNGDPIEAQSQLEILLGSTNEHPDDVRHLLGKAEGEVSTGDPEIATLHLHSVLELIKEPYEVATSIPWRPDRDANEDGNTNEKRANRAKATLEWYKAAQMDEGGPLDPDTISDFLADLRHYCQREQVKFDEYLGVGNSNYFNER